MRSAAAGILGLSFKGETVKEILLEEKLPIARELYVSLTLDRAARVPILMVSAKGGVEIESVEDSAIDRQPIDTFAGLTGYEKRRAAKVLGLNGGAAKSLDRLLDGLWKVFLAEDAELV